MYSFGNDYSEGAHPVIMERLLELNQCQNVGYGEDALCEQAKRQLKAKLHCEDCDIHFLVGGTQANLTVIAGALRPYEAVIAVDSGHINVHETGAVEATGHKVLIAEGVDGKITPQGIRKAVLSHEDEHMVKPAMVYISNATEIGTIYHKEELKQIAEVCREFGLYLFMDGARMGAALAAKDNDVSFNDLCTYCDVFYLGGTKNGALFGEAVIIVNDKLKKDFRYMIKQRGGMLAKGWLLGVQFAALFEGNRYIEIAAHANRMAQKLQDAMEASGLPFLIKTTTNQIFPVLPNLLIEELQKEYAFQVWETMDEEHTAMRFVTSWATEEKEVDRFIEYLNSLLQRMRESGQESER